MRELIDAPQPVHSSLYPLVRRVERHDWASVALGGYTPPVATVVSRLESQAPASVQAAMESVVNQTYPSREWLIVTAHDMPAPTLPDSRSIPVSVLRTGSNGNGWVEAARHAEGAFVAIMRPGANWPRHRISEDVAKLLRTPHAVACEHATSAASTCLPDDPQGLTIRREALLGRP